VGTPITVAEILTGAAAVFDFEPLSYWVTGVTITAGADLKDVIVWGVQKTCEEAKAEKGINYVPSGIIYEFVWEITTNVESTVISSVKLDFKIERDWANQNQVDEQTIKLYRCNNGTWQILPTTLLYADEKYLYYEAISPGFSVFAAIGEKVKETIPQPIVKPIEITLPIEFFSILAMAGGLAGFAIIYALTSPSKYFALLRKLEKAVVKPKERSVGETEAEAPVSKEAAKVDIARLKQLRQMSQKSGKRARKAPEKRQAGKSKRPRQK
jgi:PGF-pre-PGF domain-containing protein